MKSKYDEPDTSERTNANSSISMILQHDHSIEHNQTSRSKNDNLNLERAHSPEIHRESYNHNHSHEDDLNGGEDHHHIKAYNLNITEKMRSLLILMVVIDFKSGDSVRLKRFEK